MSCMRVEYVTYNRDDIWEYGALYVDGRYVSPTLRLIGKSPPPTAEQIQAVEAKRAEKARIFWESKNGGYTN